MQHAAYAYSICLMERMGSQRRAHTSGFCSPDANILPPTAMRQHTPCGAQAIWSVLIVLETCPLTRATTALLAKPLEMPATRVVPTPQHNSRQPLFNPRPAPFSPQSPHIVLPTACLLDDYPRSRHGGATRGRVSIGACSIIGASMQHHWSMKLCQSITHRDLKRSGFVT